MSVGFGWKYSEDDKYYRGVCESIEDCIKDAAEVDANKPFVYVDELLEEYMPKIDARSTLEVDLALGGCPYEELEAELNEVIERWAKRHNISFGYLVKSSMVYDIGTGERIW